MIAGIMPPPLHRRPLGDGILPDRSDGQVGDWPKTGGCMSRN
ncbi:hypothetical protein RRSWK_03899 [Rhodopirellula sp. SWK7]|nr:hypothetical protein RRSWK_03899 [Rhodopirellula sp. SWK7]